MILVKIKNQILYLTTDIVGLTFEEQIDLDNPDKEEVAQRISVAVNGLITQEQLNAIM